MAMNTLLIGAILFARQDVTIYNMNDYYIQFGKYLSCVTNKHMLIGEAQYKAT